MTRIMRSGKTPKVYVPGRKSDLGLGVNEILEIGNFNL